MPFQGNSPGPDHPNRTAIPQQHLHEDPIKLSWIGKPTAEANTSPLWKQLELVKEANEYRAGEMADTIRAKLPKELRDLLTAVKPIGQDVYGRTAIVFELHDPDRKLWFVPKPEMFDFKSDERIPVGDDPKRDPDTKVLATITAAGLSYDRHQCEILRSRVGIVVKLDETSPTGSRVEYTFSSLSAVQESLQHMVGNNLVEFREDSASSNENDDVAPLKLRNSRRPAAHATPGSLDPKNDRFCIARELLERACAPFYDAWGIGLAPAERPCFLGLSLSRRDHMSCSVTLELPGKTDTRGVPFEQTVHFKAKYHSGSLAFSHEAIEEPGPSYGF